MPDIYEQAWKGKLDEATISSNRKIINDKGGKWMITLLGAACRNGHLDVVRRLLKYSANPNALSANDRTPLFYATSSYPPPADRPAIVKALLDANADPNLAYAGDGLNTPLMNAITQSRDKEVIHLLIDHGAKKDVPNSRNQTAEMLAKGLKMDQELLPEKERDTSRGQIFDAFISAVGNVIGYANSGIRGRVNNVIKKAKGVVEKVFGLKGEPDKEFVKDIGQPTTPDEFEASVGKYMEQMNFDKFLPPGDNFFKELAKRAAALRDDPTTDLGKPENIKRLTRLALYQPVLYCDDSDSMAGDRWDRQRELIARIARVATILVPEHLRIELRFINADSRSKHTAKDILKAVDDVEPDGLTPVGTSLRKKILQPLVYDFLNKGNPLPRPILICTILDGNPEDEPRSAFLDEIAECRKKLMSRNYNPTTVKFSINQIGDDEKATRFLESLRTDSRVKDVIHCTAEKLDEKFSEMRRNEKELEVWLLKLLTSPIMHRDDQ